MRRHASTALTILCLVITGLGIYNVYGDNAEVVASAKQTACGGASDCDPQVASFSRTPFKQGFSIHTAKGDVSVTCKRAAVFVGSYACTSP